MNYQQQRPMAHNYNGATPPPPKKNMQSFDPLLSGNRNTQPSNAYARTAQPAPQQGTPGNSNITAEQLSFLQNQGYPNGMIQSIMHRRALFPVRLWILDNGALMNVHDAHILQPDYSQTVQATRWQELASVVAYHADFYARFHMPTRFALLNAPTTAPAPLPQYFSLLQTNNLAQEQHVLSQVLQQPPPAKGPTTLTAQVQILQQYVASMAAGLRAHQHTVSVILVTQGLPTNERGESSPQITHDFVQALRALSALPVWVVIRLCTDDEKTFEFYNSLDAHAVQHLENVDVLDDFYGEALEVYLRNPWLCYALVLHRYRESGLRQAAVLDVIDERALTLPELRLLAAFLFGTTTFPDPAVDWAAFLRAIEACQSRERAHFNPTLKQVTPWINVQLLHAIYTSGGIPAAAPQPPQQTRAANAPSRPPPPPTAGPAPAAPPQQTSGNAVGGMPTAPAAAPSKKPQTNSELDQALAQQWSKQAPAFTQTKPLPELLATLHTTFDVVESPPHEYFGKFHAFSSNALQANNAAVLKRAVRKTRLFLHPDKLPSDLSELQQHLCRTLWDVVSEAWDAFQTEQEQPNGETK